MAILHVRNVPDRLYKCIQEFAKEENSSLSTEIIRLLDQGVRARESHRNAARVLERIGRRAQKVKLSRGWKDAALLLREDRSR